MSNTKKLWFKRKKYGWGWYPSSWQGWAVTLAYVFVVVAFSLTIDDHSPMKEVMLSFALPAIIATFCFMRIAYKRGEAPRWQWGRRDKGLVEIAVFILGMGVMGAYFLYEFQKASALGA